MTDEDILFNDVYVHFRVPAGSVRAVDGVSTRFAARHITGLIGESGCGKSVLGLSILGLLPPYAHISGDIRLGDHAVTGAKPRALRALRGREVGLIPQSPGESLNPVRRIGSQLEEALSLAEPNRKQRQQRALSLLRDFGFKDPAHILRAYPFQLSGGMQQRVLCAIGVCCAPSWVLADEPTKGLDEALCRQVEETLSGLGDFGVQSMLIITHDLHLAASLCDTVAVMYGGQIVEMGSNILTNPRHPYTRAFLESLPENGMQPMPGRPPAPGDNLPGCKFAPRCPHASERCKTTPPDIIRHNNSQVRCFLYA